MKLHINRVRGVEADACCDVFNNIGHNGWWAMVAYQKELGLVMEPDAQIMDHEIKIQCCYPDCQKDMGSKVGGNKPGMIPDGICPECMKKHYPGFAKERNEKKIHAHEA